MKENRKEENRMKEESKGRGIERKGNRKEGESNDEEAYRKFKFNSKTRKVSTGALDPFLFLFHITFYIIEPLLIQDFDFLFP